MFKTIAIVVAVVLVVAVAAILVLAVTKPDTFQVQRSTSIKAPPGRIFPFINDFDNWAAWSPYEKKDPAMKRTRSGADVGKGAVYAWDGDKNVGQGQMEITESSPPSRITIKLDFTRPLEAHNIAMFTLEPQGDSTTVTWTMDGPAPFISKVMQVFLDLDSMIGKDFEAGLASLKAVAEQ